MSLMKSFLGLGAAAGAALFALKVAQRYEDNRLAEAQQAACGADPSQEPARSVFGDIARAASDVISDAGMLVREALTGGEEEPEDEWEVFPDGVDAQEFVDANEAEILSCTDFEEPQDSGTAQDACEPDDDDLLRHVQKAVATGLEELEPEEQPQQEPEKAGE